MQSNLLKQNNNLKYIKMQKNFTQQIKEFRENLLNKTCEICGTQFRAGRVDKIYCSGACREKSYRNRLIFKLQIEQNSNNTT